MKFLVKFEQSWLDICATRRQRLQNEEAAMKKIDEAKLESDLGYRFQYLCEFMGFGEEDINTILGAKGLLAPLVPALVDAVYDKLQTYDSTWRHFVPKQSGYQGPTATSVADLPMDHSTIKFRKE